MEIKVLDKKYNQFYHSNLVKEALPVIKCGSHPKNRIEAIIKEHHQGNVILDIGCGNGLLLYQFRSSYEKLIGIEYSSSRLEQAKINLADFYFEAIQGSAEDLSAIESSTVDTIISADTIEHIPDVYAAVNEMYRVLKPNGKLIINTPNIAFIKKRLLLLLGRFPSTSQSNEGLGNDILFDGGHLHYFTFRSLSLLLEKSGFLVEKKTGYGKYGFIQNSIPTLLSGGVQITATKKV